MRVSLFVVFAAVVAAGASAVVACSTSSDNTVYGPPDSGKLAAVYCIRDLDCQQDGGAQICGFSIADGCASRGVCVSFVPPAQKCPATSTYCGCNGGTVNACGVQDGYVQGGPTNGTAATLVDGSASCK